MELKIACGNSRTTKRWSNKTISFDALCERLRTTRRTTETVSEYQKMPKAQRDERKDIGGFVLGYLNEGRRSKKTVGCRSAIALDADHAKQDFVNNMKMECPYNCVIYSTHSHTPGEPRLRVIIPVVRDMTPQEYAAISRYVADEIGMDYFDDSTYEPERLMYWPSTPVDGEYICEVLKGKLLDPDEILAAHLNWRDCSFWPTSSRQSEVVRHDSSKRQEDPLTKDGIVGVFCRAFTIEDAIETFLPNVYGPSSVEGRYDYIPADSAAGLVIYEGKFAYSHHATDPANGRLLNAFDIVRVHLFPDMDEKESFAAMANLAVKNERVKETLTEERMEQAREDFIEGSYVDMRVQSGSLIKPAAKVYSCDVPWLIEGFLIRGSLTGLQGLPDSGKSWFTCATAVAVANGGYFPRADGTMIKLDPGHVLLANFDDALEFGIKPRLEALGLTDEGAERVSFLDPEAAAGLTFDDKRLATVFEECKPVLAIFDTLQHFIGKVDLHRANETNTAMVRLKLLAERYNTAVIIVQHISKNAAGGNGGASVLWGLGSTAINGLFRSLWTIGKVKGDDETLRAAVSSKNNLLPYIPPALQYSLSQSEGFQWRGVSHELTARDLIKGDSEKNSRGRPSEQRNEAEEFIFNTLAFGKVKASEVFSLAEHEGISERTIKRAKSRLGVMTYQEGHEWYWEMPKGAQSANIL